MDSDDDVIDELMMMLMMMVMMMWGMRRLNRLEAGAQRRDLTSKTSSGQTKAGFRQKSVLTNMNMKKLFTIIAKHLHSVVCTLANAPKYILS